MKIPEIEMLKMTNTAVGHTQSTSYQSLYTKIPNAARTNADEKVKSFDDYILEAVEKMNSQQMDVSNLQQQAITDPDSVDIHDITTAMAKAQMSMTLAKTVIDRLVTGWNEITTTR
jgi:flagellar hook-basal body complex protein FliE